MWTKPSPLSQQKYLCRMKKVQSYQSLQIWNKYIGTLIEIFKQFRLNWQRNCNLDQVGRSGVHCLFKVHSFRTKTLESNLVDMDCNLVSENWAESGIAHHITMSCNLWSSKYLIFKVFDQVTFAILNLIEACRFQKKKTHCYATGHRILNSPQLVPRGPWQRRGICSAVATISGKKNDKKIYVLNCKICTKRDTLCNWLTHNKLCVVFIRGHTFIVVMYSKGCHLVGFMVLINYVHSHFS